MTTITPLVSEAAASAREVLLSAKPTVTISCGTKFHSDQVAYQLDRHGMLNTVLTSHPAKYYLNRVPLHRQKVSFLPPIFLLAYGIRKLFGSSNAVAGWLNYRLPVLYDGLAARRLKKTDVLLTWAWSGLSTIRKAKRAGGIAIVEECGSCSRFQNEILSEEYDNLGIRFGNRTPEFIVERQIEEARLADFLLCPSNHVANSFIKYGVAKEKCKVIPYGANVDHFKPSPTQQEKFTLLFVGSVGVRKGLIYLFRALELLQAKHVLECVLIGSLEAEFVPVFEKYKHLFKHLPHVPHDKLVDHYNRASVFVFPSLDEGMALVQLEALACGLPVICTPNSGGDAAVTDGVEGFVIPIREPIAIADRVERLISDPELRNRMATSARKKALTFSWDVYGEKLAEFIQVINSRRQDYTEEQEQNV